MTSAGPDSLPTRSFTFFDRVVVGDPRSGEVGVLDDLAVRVLHCLLDGAPGRAAEVVAAESGLDAADSIQAVESFRSHFRSLGLLG